MKTFATREKSVESLDLNWVRAQFPALNQIVNGHPAVFLDGPAGTQVPQRVIGAMRDYFEQANANTCGAFATSRRNDAMIASARAAMADFLNCSSDEISFGQNMTTITFALARAIARELREGDEIVITTLDHDANVSPWRALEERGIVIRQVDIREEDCTLDIQDLRGKLSSRTKLVAVGLASNAVGTINPVEEIVRLAHSAGALAFVDAVHFAPHGPIDVRALDCDFLACSTYKFYGPHMGCLYGKRENLLRFRPYKVRAATDALPDRWETGTQVQEGIAGIAAAVDYIADLGRHCAGADQAAVALGDAKKTPSRDSSPSQSLRQSVVSVAPAHGDMSEIPTAEAPSRRGAILAAYQAIRSHEMALAGKLISGLTAIAGLRFYGISDPERFSERCPTVAIRLAHHSPLEIATYLGDRGIFTWDGNYYALNLTERLGVEQSGGLLRIGIVHYNTAREIDRFLDALNAFSRIETRNRRSIADA